MYFCLLHIIIDFYIYLKIIKVLESIPLFSNPIGIKLLKFRGDHFRFGSVFIKKK